MKSNFERIGLDRISPKGCVCIAVGCGFLGWLGLGTVLAAAGEVQSAAPNRLEMTMGLFGGLAFFLFGMDEMGTGLKAAAGERMKDILARLTRNRVFAAITGALVTAVIQSSSVTTVLMVGFVSAGLMSLSQSVGIIMGANVGTTITAQIVAFKVEDAALIMIAVGFAMKFLWKRDVVKNYGAILMGLGLVFYGMGVMSDAMKPLRSYQPFLDLMASMDDPVLAIIVGAGFTALVQSSSATTGIIIILASQGFVSLEAGIALSFGANIGTCVTALLAALGKPREAIRVAIVHVLFNVLGVLLWLGFLAQLGDLTVAVSPAYPELTGLERAAAETPRQIANANTLFNVINTLVFLSFTGVIARMATFLVPDVEVDERQLVRPKYLDEELIDTPALALGRVRLEISHLGEIVEQMLAQLPEAYQTRDLERLDDIMKLDDRVDLLETEIISYLGKIRKRTLSEEESRQFVALMHATDSLESIGDLVETDIVLLCKKWIALDVEPSDTMLAILQELYQVVVCSVECAVQAVQKSDQVLAQEVVTLKGDVDRAVDRSLQHQGLVLKDGNPKRLQIFRIEMELVEKFKQIHTLAKRIARGVLPDEVANRVE